MNQRYPDLWTESYNFVVFTLNSNAPPTLPNRDNPDANNTLSVVLQLRPPPKLQRKTYATVFLFVCLLVGSFWSLSAMYVKRKSIRIWEITVTECLLVSSR